MNALAELTTLEAADSFIARHIAPTEAEIASGSENRAGEHPCAAGDGPAARD